MLLASLADLQPGARVPSVFAALLDRLERYAASGEAAAALLLEPATFDRLAAAADAVAARNPDMPPADIAALYAALAQFGAAVGGGCLPAVDASLAACAAALAARGGLPPGDTRAVAAVVDLLSQPLASGRDVTAVLSLPSFPALCAALPRRARKDVASKVAAAVVGRDVPVGDVARVGVLLTFVEPLLKDDLAGAATDGLVPASGAYSDDDDEAFAEEQGLVARMLHRLASPDVDAHWAALQAARAAVAGGGPRRLPHTLPPLAFGALDVAQRCAAAGRVGDDRAGSDGDVLTAAASRKKAGKAGGAAGAGDTAANTTTADDDDAGPATAAAALRFVASVIAQLADEGGAPEPALALHLAAGLVASDDAGLELVAADAFEQAFVLYEEALPDSSAQRSALGAIAGALHRARGLPPDSRDALAHKAAGYSAKLLRKADQCRALCAVSHLYWQDDGRPAPTPRAHPPVRDGERATACLRRALKAAHAAQQRAAAARRAGGDTGPASLYIDVLNEFVAYAADGAAGADGEVLATLGDLVANAMAEDVCAADAGLVAYYEATLETARDLAAGGGVAAERLAGVFGGGVGT